MYLIMFTYSIQVLISLVAYYIQACILISLS